MTLSRSTNVEALLWYSNFLLSLSMGESEWSGGTLGRQPSSEWVVWLNHWLIGWLFCLSVDRLRVVYLSDVLQFSFGRQILGASVGWGGSHSLVSEHPRSHYSINWLMRFVSFYINQQKIWPSTEQQIKRDCFSQAIRSFDMTSRKSFSCYFWLPNKILTPANYLFCKRPSTWFFSGVRLSE